MKNKFRYDVVVVIGLIVYLAVIFVSSHVTLASANNRPRPHPSPAVSLRAQDWNILYSIGVNPHPTQNSSGGGWYFDFPIYNGSINDCGVTITCPGVHYVTVPYSTAITGTSLTMTLQIEASGTPSFNYRLEPGNTCIFPARVRAFLQHTNDYGGEFYRWWANPISYQLGAGTATVTVPLTPDQWSSVYGKFGNYNATSLTWFRDTLAHIANVGMTFGGGCFFGHGVNVSNGTARFKLINYTIQ